ncbi:iron complex outermembrane recepter protein [Flaviramulus basaltis]|uniref:Iron complex outermembrane recepter protein n=1 Tax=Flaviramulus basaltis TaxID=369401 RepID=A0A1K2INT0_9FLAO|nr:TonB-dependent receptor [Flaviramulus basaltis]SFZ93347.1 iron complex outermembrane recepter protein [Flaviramulus basaltis]
MHFIKKSLLIFLIIQTTYCSYSQSNIKGKIVDNDNFTPLALSIIKNAETNSIITSNIDGTFEINISGTYSFKKEGYFEKIIELEVNQYYIIQLSINPSELNEIVINANHIPKKLKKASASISIISYKDIQRSNNTDFAPILNRTPGVFMQSGALNTNRITIRGIGSRNLFGTSKIRAYFKDIPLTNGSGSSTIEDFELASISRFEIIKGAASSIYGAGLGGTIHLTPQNAYLKNFNLNSELSIGSFGLIKGIINVNHGTTKNSLRAVYSNTHSDGYRENNEYDRQTITLTSNHFLSDKDELSFLGSYVDLKAFIPSSIDENTYLTNPKSAAFTWKQAKGYEDSQRGIFGVSWNHEYNTTLKQATSIFTSFRNAYEPRPFNILKEKTFAIGLRSRLLGKFKLFKNNLEWTLGAEFFKDTYNYGTFENLYEDFTSGTGSVEGNRLSDFKENRDYYNVFAEVNYEFSEKTTISIGLNLNKTSYKLNDNFPVSDSNPDQSGDFKFKNIISPKFGISHLISKDLSVYSNVSHGFSPISLEETLLPDGQINTGLKPETGWNFEIGTRGSILNNRLQFSASVYQLNIKNLLVSRRVDEDQYIGVNAGKTQHNGLELDLNYKWVSKESVSISSFINYTLNNFTFKKFIDDTEDYSRNDLTGVPSNVFNAGIDFDMAIGFYGNINYQYIGEMPITDSNSLYSSSYNLTNLKIGYKINLNKKLKLNAFLGLNNIFDEHYASQILINTSGFGGSAPRYYYPGNPVNYYTGININYIF